jgi:tripartite ATP-independent transporter DctP family solute receptor
VKAASVVGLLLSLATAACTEKSATEVVTLAHNLPVTHPVHQALVHMQERVAALSGGKMQIRIFSDGQLGAERVVLELLQIGSVDMTKVSASAISNFAPEYQVLELPFLFRDDAHRFAVLDGPIGKQILESGVEFWLRGLVFFDAGSRNFYSCNDPIRTPEDLDGIKVRVMGSKIAIDMIGALGAAATPISFGELYTALQQGIVDAAENNPPSYHISRHYEVCKYYTLDRHTAVPDVLLISTRRWDTLDEQQRQWLVQAAAESAEVQKELWRKAEEQSMEAVRRAGVEIITPDREPFRQRTRKVIESYRSQPGLGDLITRIEQTP